MTSSDYNIDEEVVTDFYPFYRVYKDGRVHRFYELYGIKDVPASPEDPATGVSSKDINITPHVSARLYLPKKTPANEKLPVLVYYHGGGLVAGSAFFETEHRYLNHFVAAANCIAVSVNYRLAPEHDLSILYEDCWTALQWAASHTDKDSTITEKEPWFTNHGDFNRLFIAGDSAGGNIVYNVAMRAGKESLNGNVKILGAIFACPFLLFPLVENIEEALSYKLWVRICPPSEPGVDSPLVNPVSEKSQSLSTIGTSRIFLSTGEKDELVPKEIGTRFVEELKKSGWKGELEFVEVQGEGHCFQGVNPETEKAKDLIKRMASFIQRK